MDTREKMEKLEEEMNSKYINRREEIRGLFVTMLARGNMVLLGQAGTAKTDMVQTLARAIQSDCFETILTRTSSPEELFGAYDIRELEQGNYIRNTKNTLATAQFGFIDEVFKCNSAVLNGLLGVMAQRTYRNGNSTPSPIPLQLLVGASNELPEGGTDGELAALWDRFELRYVVDYIKDEKSFIKLLSINGDLEPKTVIPIDEIIAAQSEVKEVEFSPIEQILVGIWKRMKEEGMSISDRKWRNSLKYLKANAWLEGRNKLDEDDAEILKHMLWQNPEQIKKVRKIISEFANPESAQAQELSDAALEMMAVLGEYSDDEEENRKNDRGTKAQKAIETHSRLTRIRKTLTGIKNTMAAKGKNTKAVEESISKVNNMIVDVTKILTDGI